MTERIFDSPDDRVAQHIRRHLETGDSRPGFDDLLLTTRGRRSGKLRRTLLVYTRDKDRFILAASNAGSDRHPAWYLNVVDEPDVTVQIGECVFRATARSASPADRPRLWQLVVAAMPSYQHYQDATRRTIPVVILERTDQVDGAPVPPAG